MGRLEGFRNWNFKLPSITKTNAVNQRFYSLDVFRGATVCLMILVNNPGSWGSIYARWNMHPGMA